MNHKIVHKKGSEFKKCQVVVLYLKSQKYGSAKWGYLGQIKTFRKFFLRV